MNRVPLSVTAFGEMVSRSSIRATASHAHLIGYGHANNELRLAAHMKRFGESSSNHSLNVSLFVSRIHEMRPERK